MAVVLRSLAKRRVTAVLAAIAFVPAAAAQPGDDPIAASNRMTDPWVAPKPVVTPVEAPWLVPAEPKGKLLLQRITAKPAEEAPAVIWEAPVRRPLEPTMPVPDRPMMPCEPVFVAAPTPRACDPSKMPLPRPRPMCPGDVTLDPPVAVVTASAEEPAPAHVKSIRFLEEPSSSPRREDTVIMAMIRRGGTTAARVSDVRSALERVCHGSTIDCQTEVAGERQIRVVLTVPTAAEWDGLFERLQQLSDLGEYGLVIEVHVKK
jgi:hypothetical protein